MLKIIDLTQDIQFGAMLRKLRKDHNVSMPELMQYLQLCGLNYTTKGHLYKWEDGSIRPDYKCLCALSCLYGVNLLDLALDAYAARL